MPPFDECCVLIPAATLEDFPSDLSDYDAQSLLAAWTVLWHPQLLARTQQIPAWYRADGPPEPIGNRLIALPTPSAPQLPDGYETRVRQSEQARLISGRSRDEMAGLLLLEVRDPIRGADRTIGVDDFYAAGFAVLQIQVMTRRLRYTSNLDEIHLQNRVVSAATSFLDGQADAAIAALHDVFDSLAEERDHYFSSDPHLIDLTLTSQSTIEPLLDVISRDRPDSDWPPESGSNEHRALPTPVNLLIDVDVAEAIADADPSRTARLRACLGNGQLGWAGGGPSAQECLDAMTLAQAERAFVDAYQRTAAALSVAPTVYGRFSGSTPPDMTRVLVKLGYCGMIPIDFAHGTGHGDEAKVIIQTAGTEMEALTAKPIDAGRDASFLALGARLGEAIDGGEIATGLLVHWPGQECTSMRDLRRAASWSLALGRFWKLDDYFDEGERPYHHGTTNSSPAGSAQLLETSDRNPISLLASQFRQQIVEESDDMTAAMAALVTGDAVDSGSPPAQRFASAVVPAGDGDAPSMMLINPHSVACRDSVTLPGGPPAPAKHLYASSPGGDGGTVTTVDIPAHGFVILPSGNQDAREVTSLRTRIRQKLFGGPKRIAEERRLQNEFMEVTLSGQSGGISGVYSGQSRGNRCSMRLVRQRPDTSDAASESIMRCSGLRVIKSTAAVGCIESSGEICDAGETTSSPLATFSLRYTLERGSRVIRIDGELIPRDPLEGDPWKDYFAVRAAVVMEAAIYRALLRDKVHRTRCRRIVAPLGVVIDEAERQTMIGASGLAFHRRIGDRFLDTLLVTRGESQHKFTLFYGLDVPCPAGVARSLIAPPVQIPVPTRASGGQIGWIMHAAPKDVLISSLTARRRKDGRLAAVLRLIHTRSQSVKASIRFLRDVQCAVRLDGASDDPLNHPLPKPPSQPGNGANESDRDAIGPQAGQDRSVTPLQCHGDRVSLTIAGHGVVDLLVVFRADENAGDL